MKWIGAVYLIWLGIQALRSNSSAYTQQQPAQGASSSAAYRQGVLVAVLNPKVAIFFLAFLPQFVVVGAGPESLQLLVHGVLIVAVAALVEIPLVLVGAKLASYLKQKPQIGALMDRTLGVLFIGLGLRLALSERA